MLSICSHSFPISFATLLHLMMMYCHDSPWEGKPLIEKPQKKEEQKEGRSHHVRVKCRIAGCDANVQDIRRHLKMHIKNSELHPEDLDAYTEIMRHGEQKTLVSKPISETRAKKPAQRRKKWCPFLECAKICVRMDKHLQNVHKLKVGTVPYKVYLKEAKVYKGVMELDNPPRSVPGPSTSAAAPAVTASPADCEDGLSTSGETQMCPPTDLKSDS